MAHKHVYVCYKCKLKEFLSNKYIRWTGELTIAILGALVMKEELTILSLSEKGAEVTVVESLFSSLVERL